MEAAGQTPKDNYRAWLLLLWVWTTALWSQTVLPAGLHSSTLLPQDLGQQGTSSAATIDASVDSLAQQPALAGNVGEDDSAARHRSHSRTWRYGGLSAISEHSAQSRANRRSNTAVEIQPSEFPDFDVAVTSAESPTQWGLTGDGSRATTSGASRILAQATTGDRKEESERRSTEDLFDLDGDKSADNDAKSVDDLFGLEEKTQAEEKRPRVMGYFQNELAYTYADPSHFSKFRNTLQLGTQGRFSDNVKWEASARVIYDPIYDLDDFYPKEVEDDQELQAQIRETFLDIAGTVDFRIGRQHVIWGEVVGIFVADVVSARDMRDFWGIDLEQARIPQWAARGEYFAGDFHLDAVWIPYMTYDDIGKPGAEFYPLQLPPPPGFGIQILDKDQPRDLEDSAYGMRFSYLYSGWDSSLFYYGSMDRTPAFARRVTEEPAPTLVFRPIHDRIHQLGATLTKDFGPTVFKAEAVYTMDRLFGVNRPSVPNGLVEKDQLEYVLSLDFVFRDETRFNVQFVQEWIPDHESDMLQDEVESVVTLFLSTRAPHADVEPQAFFFRSLDQTEWLFRAQVKWEFGRNWYVIGGVDVFEGPDGGTLVDPQSGLIGQFDAKDRVFYELRYIF